MSADTATIAAFLCSYAYDRTGAKPEDFYPNASYAWMWDDIRQDLSEWERYSCEDTDAQVLYCYNRIDNTVWVAFRGTESFKDAMVDATIVKRTARFLQDTAPHARVHGGFLSHFKATKDHSLEYINRFPNRKRVVVTGHSLGGAIATLFATFLLDDKHEHRVQCNVFGCPRVGNKAFCNRANSLLTIKRFVVGYDPVTALPTRFRWQHAGKRSWYLNNSKVRGGNAEIDPWYNAACLPNMFCVGDHSMSGYIDSVASDACSVEDNSMAWWTAGYQGITMTCMAALGCITWITGRP